MSGGEEGSGNAVEIGEVRQAVLSDDTDRPNAASVYKVLGDSHSEVVAVEGGPHAIDGPAPALGRRLDVDEAGEVVGEKTRCSHARILVHQ